MPRTWKLTLEYDGSGYSGWQEQANAKSVAGEVRRAAEALLRQPVDLQGAGRTDAGVHALGQVAHLRIATSSAPPVEVIQSALNDRLPATIAVLRVEEAPPRFHARHSALSRTYVYRIATRKSAFHKRHVWWVKERLDVAAMSMAARMLEGRHDFACFRAIDKADPDHARESTVVVVNSAGIEPEGDQLLFRIDASHFLWRMVRRLVGLLVRIGLGEATPDDLGRLLKGRPDPRFDVAAWTAPASGLYLESVRYR
jgi:tRNA pseudouridine38-40 synthase